MGAMRENNENLLAVAWWVILNSPDLFYIIITYKYRFIKFLHKFSVLVNVKKIKIFILS